MNPDAECLAKGGPFALFERKVVKYNFLTSPGVNTRKTIPEDGIAV